MDWIYIALFYLSALQCCQDVFVFQMSVRPLWDHAVWAEITGAAFFNDVGRATANHSVTSAGIVTGDRPCKCSFPQSAHWRSYTWEEAYVSLHPSHCFNRETDAFTLGLSLFIWNSNFCSNVGKSWIFRPRLRVRQHPVWSSRTCSYNSLWAWPIVRPVDLSVN